MYELLSVAFADGYKTGCYPFPFESCHCPLAQLYLTPNPPVGLRGQHAEIIRNNVFSKIQIPVMPSDVANNPAEEMVLLIVGKCTLQPSCALPRQLLLSAVPVGYVYVSSPFIQMLNLLFHSSEQSPKTMLVCLQYVSNQQFAQSS